MPALRQRLRLRAFASRGRRRLRPRALAGCGPQRAPALLFARPCDRASPDHVLMALAVPTDELGVLVNPRACECVPRTIQLVVEVAGCWVPKKHSDQLPES